MFGPDIHDFLYSAHAEHVPRTIKIMLSMRLRS